MHVQQEAWLHVRVYRTNLVHAHGIGGEHVPVDRHDVLQAQFISRLEGLAYRHVADDAAASAEEVVFVHGQQCRGDRLERVQPVDQRSEEHTSELQSLMRISYAVFCLKKKKRAKK